MPTNVFIAILQHDSIRGNTNNAPSCHPFSPFGMQRCLLSILSNIISWTHKYNRGLRNFVSRCREDDRKGIHAESRHRSIRPLLRECHVAGSQFDLIPDLSCEKCATMSHADIIYFIPTCFVITGLQVFGENWATRSHADTFFLGNLSHHILSCDIIRARVISSGIEPVVRRQC